MENTTPPEKRSNKKLLWIIVGIVIAAAVAAAVILLPEILVQEPVNADEITVGMNKQALDRLLPQDKATVSEFFGETSMSYNDSVEVNGVIVPVADFKLYDDYIRSISYQWQYYTQEAFNAEAEKLFDYVNAMSGQFDVTYVDAEGYTDEIITVDELEFDDAKKWLGDNKCYAAYGYCCSLSVIQQASSYLVLIDLYDEGTIVEYFEQIVEHKDLPEAQNKGVSVDQLEMGMSSKEVAELLGRPTEIYPDGYVYNDAQLIVNGAELDTVEPFFSEQDELNHITAKKEMPANEIDAIWQEIEQLYAYMEQSKQPNQQLYYSQWGDEENKTPLDGADDIPHNGSERLNFVIDNDSNLYLDVRFIEEDNIVYMDLIIIDDNII